MGAKKAKAERAAERAAALVADVRAVSDVDRIIRLPGLDPAAAVRFYDVFSKLDDVLGLPAGFALGHPPAAVARRVLVRLSLAQRLYAGTSGRAGTDEPRRELALGLCMDVERAGYFAARAAEAVRNIVGNPAWLAKDGRNLHQAVEALRDVRANIDERIVTFLVAVGSDVLL